MSIYTYPTIKFINFLKKLGHTGCVFFLIYPSIVLLSSIITGSLVSTSTFLICAVLALAIAEVYCRTFRLASSRLLENGSSAILHVGIFLLLIGIFFLRLHTNLYDIVNPTDVIGMTARVARGYVPVSFTNFPEFPANYHNSFLILTGSIFKFTGLTLLHSILLGYALGFSVICLIILKLTATLKLTTKKSLLLFILLLFTTSLPLPRFFFNNQSIGILDYLMPIDMIISNSWVYGFSILFCFLCVWENKKNSWKEELFFTAILLFISISSNATVFNFVIIAYSAHSISTCIFERDFKRLVLSMAPMLLLWFVAKNIPSVNFSGAQYSFPEARVRFFVSTKRIEDFRQVCRFLLLAGPLALISVFLIARKIPRITLTHSLFLVAFTIPLFFGIRNISPWDEIHKNALVALTVGTYIFSTEFLFKLKLKPLIIGQFFLALVSWPFLYNFCFRTSLTDEVWQPISKIEQSEDVRLLKELPTAVFFPIYMAGLTENTLPMSLAGHFVKNTFYPGFLVRIKQTDWPSTNYFSSPQMFKAYLVRTKFPSMLQVDISKIGDFENAFQIFSKNEKFDFSIDFLNPILGSQFAYLKVIWKN